MQYCTADQTDLRPHHMSAVLCIMSCKKSVPERVAACAIDGKLYGRKHTHTQKLTSELHKFSVDKSGLDIASEQCVCRACELKYNCMKKRDSGEVSRFRWQVQRELCSVPLCFALSNIHTYKSILLPGETFVIPLELQALSVTLFYTKHFVTNHYQLVYRVVNAQ